MLKTLVVDAGPLLFLARLDRLELLRLGGDQALIPSAVLNEALMEAGEDEDHG